MRSLKLAIQSALKRQKHDQKQSTHQTTSRSKFKPPLEKEIQKFALEYFKARGIKCFRHNVARIVGSGKFVPVPEEEKGMGDIIVFCGGIFCAVECKREGEDQSDLQIVRQKEIEEEGGLYFIVRTTHDVINAAEMILKAKQERMRR